MKFLIATAMGGYVTSASPFVKDNAPSKTAWYVDGIKGFYDGYYSSFYKTTETKNMQACLDDDFVKQADEAIKDLTNPLAEVGVVMQMYENISRCKFEESALDIINMCVNDPNSCSIPVLL